MILFNIKRLAYSYRHGDIQLQSRLDVQTWNSYIGNFKRNPWIFCTWITKILTCNVTKGKNDLNMEKKRPRFRESGRKKKEQIREPDARWRVFHHSATHLRVSAFVVSDAGHRAPLFLLLSRNGELLFVRSVLLRPYRPAHFRGLAGNTRNCEILIAHFSDESTMVANESGEQSARARERTLCSPVATSVCLV